MLLPSQLDISVTEEDLRSVADLIRRGLKKITKMTQYPWQKSNGNEVEIDKLFVQVTLVEHCQESSGRKSTQLEHYTELFDSIMQHEGERILLKAEPGMGKTTLVKKITHDWMKGVLLMCPLCSL